MMISRAHCYNTHVHNYYESQELSEGFALEAAKTGQERLLLTSACSAGSATIDSGYEIQEIARWQFWLFLRLVVNKK